MSSVSEGYMIDGKEPKVKVNRKKEETKEKAKINNR